MSGTLRAVIGISLAVAMYVLGSLVQNASVYGFSPIVTELLKMSGGVLALVANLIPSVFKGENYQPPTTPANP